jgi:NADH:ubiquinone oxidoreductase subunit 5 (subunit L)/multisubunit Na+/H+ antiporter MnhA subunit
MVASRHSRRHRAIGPDHEPADRSLSTLPIWHLALLLGPAVATAAAALRAGPGTPTAAAWQGASLGVRADAIGSVLMLLVAFVGWVIVRHSQTCLHGERDERHYVRWLMATLASVAVVVTTNHVLVLALAWMAASLALHRLPTFYGDRPERWWPRTRSLSSADWPTCACWPPRACCSRPSARCTSTTSSRRLRPRRSCPDRHRPRCC